MINYFGDKSPMKITLGQNLLSITEYRIIQATLTSAFFALAIATRAAAFSWEPVGTYSSGIFDDSAAKISAYDPVSQNLFVTNNSTNAIDVINLSNINSPSLSFSIELNSYGGGVNSIAYADNIFAVAVENDDKQAPGTVVFFDALGNFLNSVSVGALPDSLTFTPDGSKILVANEGEPSDDYLNDPEGSVSIIDISNGILNPIVSTAGLTQFNHVVLDPSVRIFGPNATVAMDIEPEYITVSEDSRQGWVTVQETNALGILDLVSGEFTDIVGLGFKDFSLPGNGLDASDRDGEINIANYDNLFGIYNPDEIVSYKFGNQTFLITANEGDSREYVFEDDNGQEVEGFVEETKVGEVVLDPNAFPNADILQQDEVLGRLEITNTLGDTNGDGDYDELYAFGGRSFSIWDEFGTLVWDSGDDFEQITAQLVPEFFNSTNDENNFDNRSDNKGPEPEGISLGKVGGRTYAFIGLERIGGFMTYDVTDPYNASFVSYTNNRNFFGDPSAGTAGDLAPEGLLFIDAKDSPTGNALLIVANEVSGTTTIYENVPEPTSVLGLLVFAGLGSLGLKGKRKINS